MRRAAGVLACLLLLAGCSTDWSKPQDHESPLGTAYEANRQTYPFTEPLIVGCNYFRVVGQEQHHPLTDLLAYAVDKTDAASFQTAVDMSQVNC